jgi:hypothetical protein
MPPARVNTSAFQHFSFVGSDLRSLCYLQQMKSRIVCHGVWLCVWEPCR